MNSLYVTRACLSMARPNSASITVRAIGRSRSIGFGEPRDLMRWWRAAARSRTWVMTSSTNNDASLSSPVCSSRPVARIAVSGMPSRTRIHRDVEQPATDVDDPISIDTDVAEADRLLKHLGRELAVEQRGEIVDGHLRRHLIRPRGGHRPLEAEQFGQVIALFPGREQLTDPAESMPTVQQLADSPQPGQVVPASTGAILPSRRGGGRSLRSW